MSQLSYLPRSELTRILELPLAPERRSELFAAACRINTLYMIARAGSGHLGTSLSCLDIVSWVLLNELRLAPKAPEGSDCFFSSKGHDVPALYSVLIGLGLIEFDLIHRLRRLGGLPGHPDVSVPYLVTNTGSLGMGIAKAEGMVLANRLLGRRHNCFVLTGDGELQEGQIWESLAGAVSHRMGEITVVVDCNKIQSDTWVCDVSDLGDLEAKFSAFGWHVMRCHGHSPAALGRAFAGLRKVTDRPKVLIADTVKGKGVSFMQPEAMDPAEGLYKFHSGAPSEEQYARALGELVENANRLLAEAGAADAKLETAEPPPKSPRVDVQRMVAAYSRELVRQAESTPNLVVLDADLILDCGLIPFRKKFPDRFFECGIAEQTMVSQAGGMALQGLLPVVHSFSAFLSTRPNEQIYNNATERTKVIYVGSLSGLLPAGPGHSHQSVRDVSALCAIPGLVLIEPSCEEEVAAALEYCVKKCPTSCYLRLVSLPVEIPFHLPGDYRMAPGRGVVLRPGKSAVVIASGPVMLSQVFRAADLLRENNNIDLCVVNLPWLNRVDAEWLSGLAAQFPAIFTLENHYLTGGQGQMIASHLAELSLRPLPRLHRLGISQIPLCGGNAEVLAAHRLDAAGLAEDMAAHLLRDKL